MYQDVNKVPSEVRQYKGMIEEIYKEIEQFRILSANVETSADFNLYDHVY